MANMEREAGVREQQEQQMDGSRRHLRPARRIERLLAGLPKQRD